MDRLGEIHQLLIPLPGYTITINLEVLVMTAVVFFLALTFGFAVSRKKSLPPGRFQILGELIVLTFFGLTEEALGRTHAKTYAPLICALFIFLLISNWLGIIPHLEEPTRDLNTPLSLGLLGFELSLLPQLWEIHYIIHVNLAGSDLPEGHHDFLVLSAGNQHRPCKIRAW